MKRLLRFSVLLALLVAFAAELYATAPTTQAYNITFASVGTTTVTVNCTRGNGARRIIVARPYSASAWTNPSNGTDYTANAAYGSGSLLGTTERVVYRGTGRTVNVTALTGDNHWQFKVYEFNGTSTGTEYNVASGSSNNPREVYLTPAAPTLNATTNIGDKYFTVNWNSVTGASGYDIQVSGTSPFDPTDLIEGYDPYEETSGAATTETIDMNIQENDIYTWKIRTRVGNVYSAWVIDGTAINTYPSAPNTGGDVTVCSGSTPTISPTADQLNCGGCTFNFYLTATGGVAQNPNAPGNGGTDLGDATWTTPALVATTTYYVSTYKSTGAAGRKESPDRSAFIVYMPSAIAANATKTNVTCFGGTNGSVTTAATGGLGGYTYLWAPGGETTPNISSLAAGTYDLTITDVTCGATNVSQYIVTEPAVVSATTASTNVTCNGAANGTITLSAPAGGGGGTYTYLWAPGGATTASLTGLAPNTYDVTITSGLGCTATYNFVITQPAVLAINAPAYTHVLCNGAFTGAIDITPTGGTGAYTYSWTGPSAYTAATQDLTLRQAGAYNLTITDANGCTATSAFAITQTNAMAANQTVTHILCNGASTGSINTFPTGGTAPYTYLWAPGGATTQNLGTLPVGTYTLTVTDASLCTFTASYTLTSNALIVPSHTQTNVVCFGGATGVATVTSVTGGTAGYTYLWSDASTAATRSNLAAGNWTVTVGDGAGCTVSYTFTITEPASAITFTSASTNVSCFGGNNGTATISAVGGGTGPYTYTWSDIGLGTNTRSGLTVAGSPYTVTIKDALALCLTTTQTFNITQPPSAITFSHTSTNVTCFGGADGTAGVSGEAGGFGGAYSYVWSNGPVTQTVSGLTAGVYTVTVYDVIGLCNTSSYTFTITEPASAITATYSQTDVACFGGSTGVASVTAQGGGNGGPYTYLWAPGGVLGASRTGLAAGAYAVTVKDVTGTCLNQTHTFTITEPASAITAVYTPGNVSCYGGSNGTADVTAPGGGSGAGYNYVWSDGPSTAASRSGLTAGSYTVTVKDGLGLCLNCTHTFVITQPAAPISLTATATATTCALSNGSVSLANSGGTPGYTYSWTGPGGFTSAVQNPGTGTLAPGTYSVTVTDAAPGGCTATASCTVNSSAPASITGTFTNETCNLTNGTITTTPGGGTTYTYAWSDGGITTQNRTGLAGGITYTVTVTANPGGCTASQSFVVLALYEAPVVTLQPTDQKAADGGTVTFSATIGDVSTYQWQVSTNSGGSWSDVSGATSTSLTVSSLTAAMNGYLYHLTGYTPCSPVTTAVSNNAKLRVYPSTQASGIIWGSVIPGQIPLQWTNGNGDGRICVVRKHPSTGYPPIDPTDGTVYTANTSYSPTNATAAQITAGPGTTTYGSSQVIYRGTGTSSIATNLASYQRYHFKIFEYYGTTDPTFNTGTGSTNPSNRMSASKEAIPGLYETSTDGSLIVEGLYPNPAIDNVTFKLTLAEEIPVTISIFNEGGQKVMDFAAGQVMSSGDHDIRVPFNKMMASGNYVLTVSAGNEMVVYGFAVIK
jgi:hypothetical protein